MPSAWPAPPRWRSALAPLGRVTGRIVPSLAGPTTADEVWLGSRKTTPVDGAFAFEDVLLGTYRLEARRGGRVRARVDGVQLSANGQTVERTSRSSRRPRST